MLTFPFHPFVQFYHAHDENCVLVWKVKTGQMQQVVRLMHSMYSRKRRGAFTFHLLAFLIRETEYGGRIISKCLHNIDCCNNTLLLIEIRAKWSLCHFPYCEKKRMLHQWVFVNETATEIFKDLFKCDFDSNTFLLTKVCFCIPIPQFHSFYHLRQKSDVPDNNRLEWSVCVRWRV